MALSPSFPTLCDLVQPLTTNVHSLLVNCAALCSSEMLIKDESSEASISAVLIGVAQNVAILVHTEVWSLFHWTEVQI